MVLPAIHQPSISCTRPLETSKYNIQLEHSPAYILRRSDTLYYDHRYYFALILFILFLFLFLFPFLSLKTSTPNRPRSPLFFSSHPISSASILIPSHLIPVNLVPRQQPPALEHNQNKLLLLLLPRKRYKKHD